MDEQTQQSGCQLGEVADICSNPNIAQEIVCHPSWRKIVWRRHGEPKWIVPPGELVEKNQSEDWWVPLETSMQNTSEHSNTIYHDSEAQDHVQ
jgi:hypothetical protein